MIPDGWHHGTCNHNASVTVAWGGQGRHLSFQPPGCYHCRLAGDGQRNFAVTSEAVLGTSDASALAARSLEGALVPLRPVDGTRAEAAAYQSIRALLGQFLQPTIQREGMQVGSFVMCVHVHAHESRRAWSG